VGHGTLTIDLDAAAGLARKTTDPAPQSGEIDATYDNTAGTHVGGDRLCDALDQRTVSTLVERRRDDSLIRVRDDVRAGELMDSGQDRRIQREVTMADSRRSVLDLTDGPRFERARHHRERHERDGKRRSERDGRKREDDSML
ncbi:MAG TPA: hypothetical protein VLV86_24625, partial [Vicinamibacterales bacterium]|nr:hypothetical protein [Vicinamibacterales bacterium]